MTRKRLIKLLMNLGLSRNQANYMAARYRRIGMPYIMGYVDFILGFNSWSVADHWKQMHWLKSKVEKETGEKTRQNEIKEFLHRLKASLFFSVSVLFPLYRKKPRTERAHVRGFVFSAVMPCEIRYRGSSRASRSPR